jgi:hypothetical protein
MVNQVIYMNDDVSRIVARLSGERCFRKEVGRFKSLSLGFGIEAERSAKSKSRAYRSWEIGTYRSAWRVVCKGNVICGSQDAADPIRLNSALQRIEFDKFVSLQHINDLDVRVDFSNGVAVDFLATNSDDDEYFHLFCPDDVYVEFRVRSGWRIGPSDRPWGNDSGESPVKRD